MRVHTHQRPWTSSSAPGSWRTLRARNVSIIGFAIVLLGIVSYLPRVHAWDPDDEQEVEKLQYLAGTEYIDVPNPLYVARGSTVTFKAKKSLPGEDWPSNKPAWSGSAGATGSGEIKAVTFNEAGAKTVTAECGNEVTANVVAIMAEIVGLDGTGAVVAAPTDVNVARKQRFGVTITPADAAATFQWKINNSATPPRAVAIKTYSHNVETTATPTDLAAGDLTAASLSFYFTDQSPNGGNNPLPINLTVTSHGKVIDADPIQVKVTFEADMNRSIYAQEIPNADDNPAGAAIYKMNDIHNEWHVNNDAGMGTEAYGGALFFTFHQKIIDAYSSWRSLFNVPNAGTNGYARAPIAGNPLPSYLSAAGGTTKSGIYGYVRLGEVPDPEQLGDILVDPYHNDGHMESGDPDMFDPATAIMAAGNLFWKWHRELEEFQVNFATNQATPGAPTVTAPAGAGTVSITFDRPVSWDAETAPEFHSNGVQITAAALTVNGVAATNVTTVDHKIFTFTVQHLNVGNPYVIVLTGTTSFKSSPAADAAWTVTP